MTGRGRALIRIARRSRVVGLLVALALLLPLSAASAQEADPREGLGGGVQDAEQASENMDLIRHLPKPEGFFNPDNPGDFAFANSDLAFTGNHALMGNYSGFLIYDITDPANTSLRTAVACPGGQGDISVHGDLAFVSVQQLGTVNCEVLGSEEGDQEFRGVRVFDISDLDAPQQVAAVQTCRGSHTHTVVDEADGNVYVYVQGTSQVRTDDGDIPELDCEVGPTDEEGDPSNDPADFLVNGEPVETDRFQVEVIEVPLDAPEDAQIVNEARLFADPVTGNPHGLNPGAEGIATTDACHDITAYPEFGIAAGACEGNGLLIDITDPANPERIQAESDDENFAYWHSATFNNDATSVVFTDELGGGVAATCTDEVPDEFGANAIYDIEWDEDGNPSMEFASYYKVPPVQTAQENCVAHNGSLVPVPGRDIMVQAWYQGGISVMDFTDTEDPFEIAFFDRGPVDEGALVLGGFWSAYWYNGAIYGSEIARGFDVFELTASEHLTEDELAGAAAVRLDEFNAQMQPHITDADRSACGAVTPVDFPDVSGTHADNIRCIAGFGISVGRADGTYGTLASIERGQMATFLKNLLAAAGVDLPESPADAFTDDDGTTHELSINQLAELGIVSGVGDNRYNPTGTVTRAQMATFLVQTVEHILGEDLPAAPRAPFTDVSAGSTHAGNIDKAYDVGLTVGATPTSYRPGQDMQRGQMATFIVRSLEMLRLRNVALSPLGDG